MSPAIAIITALAIALLLAAVWVAYVWKRRRAGFETLEGLTILSAMRWRELSNLVVDALTVSGFTREPSDEKSRRGSQADVIVYRDERPWILTCRQGMGHSVTRQAVEEFVRRVRVEQAAGGLMVTPGRVDAAARQFVGNVELVDGPELWRLVGPLLPASVHQEVATRAKTRALRATGVAVAASTLAGAALAWALLQVPVPEAAPSAPVAVAAPRAATPVRKAAPVIEEDTAPVSEDEQRLEIVRKVSGLPGVDRALWSTRSTLQIYINDPATATDAAICSVLMKYDLLRASRLQIEAPHTEGHGVRFTQCAVY